MKIALTFLGCHRRAGVERIMLECANFLASRGHEVHVLASEFDVSSMDQRIVRHEVKTTARSRLGKLYQFRNRCPDVLKPIHADVQGAFGVISPAGGVIWVQSVHAAWLEISGQMRGFAGRMKQKLNPSHPYILRLEKQYFKERKYGKVIALTEQVKADLQRFYDVPDQDIVIVPNGFAPAEFNVTNRAAKRPAMREKFAFRDVDRVVIFVANELERKGFGPLLRAIASMKDESIHLLAVGRLNAGSYAGEIDRLGMTRRVTFTGPSSSVADYYAASDLFALPTQYEAWGLVVVEAMACGLPVVTSRLAGASIAVEEARSGELLDDPNDVAEIASKLSKMLSGNRISAEMISDSVKQYAWSRVLLEYEQTLLSCASRRQDKSPPLHAGF